MSLQGASLAASEHLGTITGEHMSTSGDAREPPDSPFDALFGKVCCTSNLVILHRILLSLLLAHDWVSSSLKENVAFLDVTICLRLCSCLARSALMEYS